VHVALEDDGSDGRAAEDLLDEREDLIGDGTRMRVEQERTVGFASRDVELDDALEGERVEERDGVVAEVLCVLKEVRDVEQHPHVGLLEDTADEGGLSHGPAWDGEVVRD